MKYPQSVKVWQDAWDRFVPFLQFPPAARKVIYTTNSIESFNNQLRKATRNRVQFTNDESALKTLWLMICNIEDKRAIKRAKQGKRASATASRLVEGAGPDPRKVDTSGVSYAALVSVAEVSASKTSGATRLHQECRRRVL